MNIDTDDFARLEAEAVAELQQKRDDSLRQRARRIAIARLRTRLVQRKTLDPGELQRRADRAGLARVRSIWTDAPCPEDFTVSAGGWAIIEDAVTWRGQKVCTPCVPLGGRQIAIKSGRKWATVTVEGEHKDSRSWAAAVIRAAEGAGLKYATGAVADDPALPDATRDDKNPKLYVGWFLAGVGLDGGLSRPCGPMPPPSNPLAGLGPWERLGLMWQAQDKQTPDAGK